MKTLKSIQKNQAQLNSLLMEKWGYGSPKNEISHLCAMLVTEKTTGKIGHPINHTLLESGSVTHYDVEFDDVIVEGMPVGTLDVEVQEEHMHGRREDYAHDEDKPRTQYAEGASEEELEEAKQFANDDKLDGDKDGKPKWADSDDPANKEKLEEQDAVFDDLADDDEISSPDVQSPALAATVDTASPANTNAQLEESHNCRSAHPGMNHDQWSDKRR